MNISSSSIESSSNKSNHANKYYEFNELNQKLIEEGEMKNVKIEQYLKHLDKYKISESESSHSEKK